MLEDVAFCEALEGFVGGVAVGDGKESLEGGGVQEGDIFLFEDLLDGECGQR